MIGLRVITLLFGLLVLLEFIDPGIISTAIPLPMLLALVIFQFAIHGRKDKPFSRRGRIALTLALTLTTITVLALWSRGYALQWPLVLIGGVVVAVAALLLLPLQRKDVL